LALIAITIVNARWILEQDGKVVVTLPDGSRLETTDLGPALAAAQRAAHATSESLFTTRSSLPRSSIALTAISSDSPFANRALVVPTR
jgi:hypothetical protein